MTQALDKIRNGMRRLKEGLPEEAFAIVGDPVEATREQILHAARHLGAHYRKAGNDLPQTLVALIG